MKEFDINTESDNLIQTTNADAIEVQHNESPDLEEIDQEKMKVTLKEVKCEYNSVTNFLPLGSVVLEEKDIFDVVKFTITVEAVYFYKWEVYRLPSEIKKNFEEISEELNRNNIVNTGNFEEMFNIVQTWTDDGIQMHVSEIENFYKNLFLIPQVYNTNKFKQFFNISLESFNQKNCGSKPFEGYVYKKADPHCLRQAFSLVCFCIEYFAFAQYNLRYFLVEEDKMYYKDKSDSSNGNNMYFFDRETKVERKGRDIIEITNSSLTLILKFKTVFEREIWYFEINKRAEQNLMILKKNKYQAYTNEKKKNQVEKFIDGEKYFADLAEKLMEARSTIYITDWMLSPEVWLKRPVDMNTYMSMAYRSQIRKETPPYSRLMDILYVRANEGVKIYIQLFAETRLAMNLGSVEAKDILSSLHPNIQVMRHPVNSLEFLYSHHEKLVIIDQNIAYIGGLDLCWGRFDTHEHPISEPTILSDNPQYLFPGIDYSNARTRDFGELREYLTESVKRDKETRLPWHDVHCRIIGPVVPDIARHFVERWNFSKNWTSVAITDLKTNSSISKENIKKNKAEIKGVDKKEEKGFVWNIINNTKFWKKNTKEDNNDKNENLISEVEKEDQKDIINNNGDNNLNDKKGFLSIIGINKKKLNLNKKNGNDIITEIKEEEKIDLLNGENNNINNNDDNKKDEDNEDIKININTKEEEVDYTKKIGYEEMKKYEEDFMRNKIVIDENHLYIPKEEDNNDNLINNNQNNLENNLFEINTNSNLIASEDNNIKKTSNNKPETYNKWVKNIAIDEKKKNGGGLFGNLFGKKDQEEEKYDDLKNTLFNVNFFSRGLKSKVQVLRSSESWSLGLKTTENSILQAYYYLIKNAKHYIYIENQFFVSRAFSEDERRKCPYALSCDVKNLIAYEIKKKILEKYRKNEKFRVFIFIPLLPGFPGEPETESTLKIILKYTYAGICRNHGCSIIEQLQKEMGDKWKDYIGFYSLRNHGIINGVPSTEIIYIHSKLMIVDDTKVIIGSANINDRSMLGTRDSEFCVLIKEKKVLNSKMDGKDYIAAKFAYNFRTNLFAEHLGLDTKDPILNDPLNDDFLKKLQNTAEKNTLTYRELWGCYPDDEYKNYKDIRRMGNFNNEELRKFKELYEKKKENIVGHVVQFPLHFLENEDLRISFFSKENFAPLETFL